MKTAKELAKSKKLATSTWAADRQQAAPTSMVGLKNIRLRDMDPTVDKVWTGYAITVTIIEPAQTWKTSSIVLAVEDSLGDAERLAIYNFPSQ